MLEGMNSLIATLSQPPPPSTTPTPPTITESIFLTIPTRVSLLDEQLSQIKDVVKQSQEILKALSQLQSLNKGIYSSIDR